MSSSYLPPVSSSNSVWNGSVYYDARHSTWSGSFRLSLGKWRKKAIPKGIQDEAEAKAWFADWLLAKTTDPK